MIALAAGTLPPGTGLTETIEIAGRAGFDGVGLRSAPGVAAGPVRRALDASGVRLLDVTAVRIGTSTVKDTDRLLEWAAEAGAAHLLVVSDLDDPAATAGELHRIADRARGTGVQPVLEFMRFTGVPDLPAALAVVTAAGDPEVAILVDALHLARSGGAAADVAALPARLRPYVQICDAPAIAPGTTEALADEARHRRLLPGEGSLPLRPLLAAYPGRPVSVEVQSDAGWAAGPAEAWAAQAYAATRSLFS